MAGALAPLLLSIVAETGKYAYEEVNPDPQLVALGQAHR